ncbi:menaquinol-cytochrome c reductase cytochrome b/c subunit [Paenibacillus sacheonensis]|uniref:C-type cytochrome n=1 Tax=Paenibacillus sacheonensis TaxID=742054 RepID=A0A7X4YMK1_9BACL|nr:menaquinol-cytochrome c reductase cytochrome b/c subunit [Paenibacillus sacheonensis]MBM7564513.1 menaquinol-cytochrome c reductase cytochrome b/c subunit [Paenibacillus sacheonensis]NBC69072.1 c-type cytochrome [Paenibacillus sacheonensis]
MAHGHKSNEKVVFVGDSRVRKKASTGPVTPPDYSAYPGKSEAFIPNFLLKEWMVGVVVLVGFLVLTISEAAPLGYPADPTNASFIPMPDWYFLFLYQFLKLQYVSKDYVVLGTVGIPGVAFGALLLAPFLDTGKERRFYRRPITSILMFMSLISVFYLTKQSWDHYEHELKITNSVPEHITREEKAREAAEEAAKAGLPAGSPPPEIPLVEAKDPTATAIIEKAKCVQCHGTDLKGNDAAGIPSFHGIGDKFSKEELVDIVTNGKDNMPSFKDTLSAEEIDQLTTWLSKQKAPAK